MEESIASFCESMASFCNHIETSCDALKQSIHRHSIPLGYHFPSLSVQPKVHFHSNFFEFLYINLVDCRFGILYLPTMSESEGFEREQRAQRSRIFVVGDRIFWGTIRSLQRDLQEQWGKSSSPPRLSRAPRICSRYLTPSYCFISS